ncbi:MAG: hypothetical protein PHV13_01025 [Candidatus ainarchaeum sp.]|nr:hypothetical protein [Candidatus ainarchaeum sp.]
MRLRGYIIAAGVAALAASPMAARPAFAAKEPAADRIAAADTAKAGNAWARENHADPPQWFMALASVAFIGGMLVLAGGKENDRANRS